MYKISLRRKCDCSKAKDHLELAAMRKYLDDNFKKHDNAGDISTSWKHLHDGIYSHTVSYQVPGAVQLLDAMSLFMSMNYEFVTRTNTEVYLSNENVIKLPAFE